MIRYDCCAPIETKHRVGSGHHRWDEALAEVIFDDPRLIDIISEFPRQEIPIWQRPWLDAAKADGYPIEYRAYVNDGAVVGISNYYPQRPLPLYDDHILQVIANTDALIAKAPTPFLWNHSLLQREFEEFQDTNQIHFTTDYFLPADSHTLLLIEDGPPHELGAHPCCFEPGDISGIALDSSTQPLPLPVYP